MKKIEYISIRTSYLDSLAHEIQQRLPDEKETNDIVDAFDDLSKGSCAAVWMELDETVHKDNDRDTIECGELMINARTRKVVRGGKDIYLTPKEFDILYFLAINRGEVFTKEQIYQAVWEKDYLLDDSNIMAFIRKIRKKIEPDPDSPIYILTIWGVGYKFTDTY